MVRETWDVHGNDGFLQACATAITPAGFAVFRSQPPILRIVGGIAADMELRMWGQLDGVAKEWLAAHLTAIQACDRIGGPRQSQVGRSLSPELTRYAYRAWCLQQALGGLTGLRVVEIGGGFGGLAAVLCNTCLPASYTIVDQQPVLNLQALYCQQAGVTVPLAFIPPEKIFAGLDVKADIVISDCALSELTDETRDAYGEHIVAHAPRGSMKFNGARRTEFTMPWVEWLAAMTGRVPVRGDWVDVLLPEQDRTMQRPDRQRNYPDLACQWYWGLSNA